MSRTIQPLSEAVASAVPVADVPYPTAKLVFDRTAAGLLIVLLSPVLLLALAVLAVDMLLVPGDRGRWFYRESRISRGREFEVMKFRVLREDVLAEIALQDGAYARLFEADHDNLTAAGRIVKRIYADELPQLFNVLRGDISLVGPRPWPVPMVEKQVAEGLDYRLHAMAGWTGPAQVRKDSKAKSRATDLDLDYLRLCRSLSGIRLVRHDLRILGQSLRTALRGRGLRY
jgi:lipopolysaccharide/colanic/teichoic acid biosynthesis glycosyltransferase